MDPAQTAVLVIDMQNDFCSPDGAMARLGANVTRNAEVATGLPPFLEKARAAGCLIVWVRQISREELVSPARRERAAAMGRGATEVCAQGSWGAELDPGLMPAKSDVFVEKPRYSAFVATELDALLRAQQRSHVVVCGTAANVCVDSTIRDAYMRDYSVVMPRNLVGWTREALARVSIENLGFYFCDLVDSGDLLESFLVSPALTA